MSAWIYELPLWQMAILIMGIFLALAMGLTLLTRNWVNRHLIEHRDLISLFSSSSGVLYSVMLAMIVVNAWQNLDELDDIIGNEAYYIGNIYRDMEAYPEPIRTELRKLFRKYVKTVIGQEWPELRAGKVSRVGRPIINQIVHTLARFKPGDSAETVVHAEVYSTLNKVLFDRRQRLAAVEESVIPVLWVVVWVGAFLNIAINTLITTDNRTVDQIFIGSYALNIGLVIFLIVALDHPFLGEVSILPTAFEEALSVMDGFDQYAAQHNDPGASR